MTTSWKAKRKLKEDEVVTSGDEMGPEFARHAGKEALPSAKWQGCGVGYPHAEAHAAASLLSRIAVVMVRPSEECLSFQQT